MRKHRPTENMLRFEYKLQMLQMTRSQLAVDKSLILIFVDSLNAHSLSISLQCYTKWMNESHCHLFVKVSSLRRENAGANGIKLCDAFRVVQITFANAAQMIAYTKFLFRKDKSKLQPLEIR